MERDKFMSAEDSKEFGLIDAVVSERPAASRAATKSRKPRPSELGWV